MLVNVYTIYDSVALESGPLFTAKNDSLALRMYTNFITSNKDIHNHIDDYELYNVGIFDTEKCLITSIEKHKVKVDIDKDPTEGDEGV